jgi:bifunctional non-homologous end joining protein LigD
VSPAPPGPPALLPMLAGGDGVPPDASAYQLEPKLDGQRVIAVVGQAGVTLTNRRGLDIAGTYPELERRPSVATAGVAVLDGEVVSFNTKGQTSFQRLQRRMHVAQPTPQLVAEVPVVFVAFDLLWLDGDLLVERPQVERRRLLEGLQIDGTAWQVVPVLDAPADELLVACRQLGLEGFMAKRLDAPYVPGGRSVAWRKVKCGRRRDFVVGGWSAGQGSRQDSIGSLALGCYDTTSEEAEHRGRPQRLFYTGQAGSGLTESMIGQLRRLFAQIAMEASPFENAVPPRLNFARPMLVADVAYTEVTDGGTLRQPSIKGLRTDIIATDVTWDEEIAAAFSPDGD